MAALKQALNQNFVKSSVIFQVLWFALVLLGSDYLLLSVAIFAIWVLTQRISIEAWGFVVLLSFVGVAFDYGVFMFNGYSFSHNQFPLWLLLLWLSFSRYLYDMLNHFEWPVLAWLVIGAVFGPLAYMAASKLDAVTVAQQSWFFITPFWAILMVFAYYSINKIKFDLTTS